MKGLLFAVALALVAIAATSAQPPQQIAALAQAIADASNANNATGLARIYTNDAMAIDENPPFVWRGAQAGTQWFGGIQRLLAGNGSSMHAVAAAPSDFQTDREGDDAYLNQRFAVAVTQNGKTTTEHGTMTYTFHKAEDGTWKIRCQIWTTSASQHVKVNPGALHAATQMMSAFNRRTPNALATLYTNDATFVDDLSPFIWNGANAGARWYAKAMKYLQANGVAEMHGTLGTPIESSAQGNVAYLIVPVTWSGTAKGKPFVQRGTYTFTLRKTGEKWLITSQTWLANS